MSSSSPFSPPPFDWFISAPSLPRIQAVYDPIFGSNYSETHANANLTVPEGSFLLLICAAFYNITWSANAAGVTETGTSECRDVLPDEWPSKKCLFGQSVSTKHTGIYSCYQSQQTDPTLVTSIQLNVVPTKTPLSDESKITQKSFETVLTWARRPVELRIEYDLGSPCNGTCDGTWILLPRTILDGRYDYQTGTIVSSSNSTNYAYVDTSQLTPTRYQSKLVIPRSCYQHSGLYRFQVERNNLTADFNVTIQLSPWRVLEPDEDRDGKKFTTRLFYGRVYEMSCLKRALGTAPWGDVSVVTEFFHSSDTQFCSHLSNYQRVEGNLPNGGYMKGMPTTPPVCGDGQRGALNFTPAHVAGSIFTFTAQKPGMVRCIFTSNFTDADGQPISNTTVTELRYKIVDRSELVPADKDFVIEKWPDKGPPLIGDPLTIRCVAPTCQYAKIVLEKESYKLMYDGDDGIIRNDFNATTSYENTSIHVIVSLTLDKATRFDSGQYQCRGYDHDIPTGSSFALDVLMEQPRPPMFDITESYAERVLLEDGEQVQLSCYVDGLPKPVLTWSFNNHPLTADDGQLRYENATLTIHKRGRYQCQAYNKYGTIQRHFAVVDGTEDNKWVMTQILVATVCAIAVLAAVCLTIWLIRRWRLASLQKLHTLMLKPAQETMPLEPFMPINDQIESLPYDDRYEMEKSNFTLCSLLGSGEYGKVYRGVIKSQNGDKDVAIKVPRDGLNIDHHKALISELKIMIFVRQHINVLSVLGACTKGTPAAGFYIITEFCDRGSLRDFLITNRDRPCSTCGQTISPVRTRGSNYSKNIRSNAIPDLKSEQKYVYVEEEHQCSYFTTDELLSYAYQSACGMEYLAAKNVIHRDLALRNLLLHGKVIKIADFGLSRHYGHAYKSRRFDSPLPIFWMALESILSYKYSEKSDVWSFGVVMWELFSLGDLPYSGKKPDQQFVQWLREGNRMDAPKIAPTETYALMLSCWNKDPDTRPTFSECKRALGQHLDSYSSSAYRSLVLTLASAKAALDDLPCVPTNSSDESRDGEFITYVCVDSADKDNSVTRTTSDLATTATPSLTDSNSSIEGECTDSVLGRTQYLTPCL